MPAYDLRGRPRPALDFVDYDAWIKAGLPPGAAIRVSNARDMNAVGETLQSAAVVALEFPGFRDGRAYTQARLLRERFAYKGEIRAVGDVLRDQILFMARAGFDAFEAPAEKVEGIIEALGEFGAFYQTCADDAEPVWRRRRLRSVAA